MKYHPARHNRRSIRLQGYDYSRAGAYFVTVCAYNRRCLFGDVVDGEMRVNLGGHVVEACWDAIPDHFPGVELDAFVVMPNHLHGVVVIPGVPKTGRGFAADDRPLIQIRRHQTLW